MKIIVLCAAIFFMATPLFSKSTKDASRIKTEIIVVMDAQAAAWNRGDIGAFMLGYWNSSDLVFVSGDNVTRGWQPTLDRYNKTYNSREKMGTLRFSDLEIDVISKNAAVVLGSWALTRANDNPKGKFTLIFRKIDGEWRIVHDHTS